MHARIYVAALGMDVAFFSAWAAVPFLVKAHPFDFSDARLGTLKAVASLAYIFGTLGLARHWDGRDKSALARGASVLAGVLWLLAAFPGRPWVLFLLLPVSGLALSAFWPTVMALLGEGAEGDLEGRLGAFNCWWSVGKAGAFLTCGVLLEVLGDPATVLVVCGGVMIGVALVLPRRGTGGEPAVHSPVRARVPGDEAVFRGALMLLFTGWFIGTSFEVHLAKGIGPLLFAVRFGDAYAFWINALLFLLYLGTALAFFGLRRFRGWSARGGLLVLGALVLCGSQMLLLFVESPWIVAFLLLLSGSTLALAYAQSLYHAQAGRSDPSRRAGIHEGVLSLGTMLGPFLSGGVMELTGNPLSAREVHAATALAALAVVLLLTRAPRSGGGGC